MIRRALLIEASKAKNQKEIMGCAEDVRRMKRWLSQNNGGGWDDDEIIVLPNPSLQQVRNTVALIGTADYSFVSFSGHGGLVEDTRTGRQTQKIVIGSGEAIDFLSLRPASGRCTLVCDACREIERLPVRLSESRELALNYQAKAARARYSRADYQRAFKASLLEVAEGMFSMYGCSPDQYCYEDPVTGGYFTSALIENASRWCDNVYQSAYMPMDVALAAASREVSDQTATKRPPQNPKGGSENRSRGNGFPFAIELK